MGLRFALMGLVASLGLQPPPKADWERWMETGRRVCTLAWEEWTAGANDPLEDGPKVSTGSVVREKPPESVAEETAGDLAFEAEMNDWIATVASSRPLPGERAGERRTKRSRIEVVEESEYAELHGEALAERLNRQPEPNWIADELPTAESIQALSVEELKEPDDLAARLNRFGELAEPEPALIAAASPKDEPIKPAPLSKRVEHAIRLTNDAASAWISLFKGALVVSLQP